MSIYPSLTVPVMMKQECILINAARGGIIDEAALVEALQEKKIWGAAIDVFAQQPVSRDNPLLQCFNFVGTPHNGANTSDALLNMGVDAVDEIMEFMAQVRAVQEEKI